MRWFHRALIVAGAVCFVLLVAQSEPASLWRDARSLGFGAVLVIGVAVFEHGLHALGWARCLAPAHRPGPLRLLGAQLAGGAVNLVTPTATLGGEVMRGGLLPPSVPSSEIVASVTADRLAMAVGDTTIGLAGMAVLVARGPFSPATRAAIAAGSLLIASGVFTFLLLQRGGRLASFFGEHGLVRRLAGEEFAKRLAEATREIDARLATLHSERAGDFRASIAIHLAGTAVGALQLAIFLAWLGEPVTLGTVAAVWAIATALDLFSFFIPARLGAQEASRMLAMSVVGLDPARGLLFSLVLRAEQILWAGAGLAVVPLLLRRRRAAAAAPDAAGPPPPLATGASGGEHAGRERKPALEGGRKAC